MNAIDRAALAAEPVPVDDRGNPGRCGVGYDAGAWYTYWLVGTTRQRFGKPYGSARQAAAASRWLNERSAA